MRRFALGALLLAACSGQTDGAAADGEAAADQRVRVEIINTTNQRGLARRAMFVLREAGFDVVRFASGGPARDSTQVLDRSGNLEQARRVAQALGAGAVTTAIDSTRYLDVSVFLGHDWRPPAKPFHP